VRHCSAIPSGQSLSSRSSVLVAPLLRFECSASEVSNNSFPGSSGKLADGSSEGENRTRAADYGEINIEGFTARFLTTRVTAAVTWWHDVPGRLASPRSASPRRWGWRWWRCGAGVIREYQTALLQLGNFDQEIAQVQGRGTAVLRQSRPASAAARRRAELVWASGCSCSGARRLDRSRADRTRRRDRCRWRRHSAHTSRQPGLSGSA
jgi:hypothetical protein